jgi:tetratricopeptide (TPR) repeat protein
LLINVWKIGREKYVAFLVVFEKMNRLSIHFESMKVSYSNSWCLFNLSAILNSLLILLSASNAASQSFKVDSLRDLLDYSTENRDADLLHSLSIEFMINGHFDSAYKYVERLRLVGEKRNDSLQIVRSIAIKASILRRSGMIDSAMTLYKMVLPIAKRKGYSEQTMNVLNSMALLYTLEARFDIALKYHFESLELRQLLRDSLALSVAAHNIGFVYYKLRNFDKALYYYGNARELRRNLKNTSDLDQLLLNIGWCYIDQGTYSVARAYIDSAFAMCKDNCSDIFLIDAFLGLGIIAQNQKEFDNAERHLIKSYLLSRKHNDVRHALENISQLSKIYIAKEKICKAEKYLDEAEQLVKDDNRYRLELATIYHQFSDLYGRTNNLVRKIYFQDKYITLKDSIFNQEMTSSLMKAESDYIERENKARIEAQNKIMSLNNEIIFRQRLANVAFALVAIFGVVLTIILARRYKAKQIANTLLDQKVSERTQELRAHHESIQRSLQENALTLKKTISELQNLVVRAEGLCILGQQEKDVDRFNDYWIKLSSTTTGIRTLIKRLAQTNSEVWRN